MSPPASLHPLHFSSSPPWFYPILPSPFSTLFPPRLLRPLSPPSPLSPPRPRFPSPRSSACPNPSSSFSILNSPPPPSCSFFPFLPSAFLLLTFLPPTPLHWIPLALYSPPRQLRSREVPIPRRRLSNSPALSIRHEAGLKTLGTNRCWLILGKSPEDKVNPAGSATGRVLRFLT